MKKRLRFATIATSSLIAATSLISAPSLMLQADARPVGSANTAELVRDADLIFVGKAIDAKVSMLPIKKSNVAGLDGWQHSTLSVDRLLKGQAAMVPVKVDIPVYMSGPSGISKGQYGVFFLKFDNKKNVYFPVDPDHHSLPAVQGHNVPAGADVIGTVSNLLTDVLATPATQLVSGSDGSVTWWDGQKVTISGAQYLYVPVVEGLSTIPSKYSKAALKKIATSGASNNRIIAIDCLISNGDWSLLPSIQADLIHPSPEVVDRIRHLAGSMESGVASMQHDSEREWVKSITGGVPLLTALLRSTDTEVRESSAAILREIGGTEVIFPLGTIGLYDKFQRVRWKAMAGLAEATGLSQYYPHFSANTGTAVTKGEAKPLNFWRQWISKNQGKPLAVPPQGGDLKIDAADKTFSDPIFHPKQPRSATRRSGGVTAGAAFIVPAGEERVALKKQWLPAMVANSEVIVVGSYHSPNIDGPQKWLDETTVRVERVLKGQINNDNKNGAQQIVVPEEMIRAVPFNHGILFLKKNAAGKYISVDKNHRGLLPAISDFKQTQSASADPLTAVISEQMQVLRTPPAQMQKRLNPGLGLTNAYMDAADSLCATSYETVGPALLELASAPSQNLHCRLWAIGCLAHHGNWSNLDSVRAALIQPSDENDYLATWIGRSMEGHITDPRAVAVIGPLTKSEDFFLSSSATRVLADIATPEAAKWLAQQLYSDNARLRFLAVKGLSKATKLRPVPTTAEFDRNQRQLVSFWRDWAINHAAR